MSTLRSQPFPGTGGTWRVVDGELVADTGAQAAAPPAEAAADTAERAADLTERDADGQQAIESTVPKPQAPAHRRRQHQE